MERQRLLVTKRVGKWGSVYVIGGTEVDGETLPAEQADDIIARFEHEQALFGRALNGSLDIGSASAAPTHTRKPIAGFQADGLDAVVQAVTSRPVPSSATPAQASTTSSPCTYAATCRPISSPDA